MTGNLRHRVLHPRLRKNAGQILTLAPAGLKPGGSTNYFLMSSFFASFGASLGASLPAAGAPVPV